MLVAIKKYKFHTTKTKFYKFIIKLGKLSIDPKKNQSNSQLVRTKQYYRTKIVLRILQLLSMLYSNIVKEYWTIHQTYQEE